MRSYSSSQIVAEAVITLTGCYRGIVFSQFARRHFSFFQVVTDAVFFPTSSNEQVLEEAVFFSHRFVDGSVFFSSGCCFKVVVPFLTGCYYSSAQFVEEAEL
jgi:hypothetical protein